MKSVRKCRRVVEVFGDVFCYHLTFLDFFCGCRVFCHRTKSDLFLFSICVQLERALIYLQHSLIELESFNSVKELSNTANIKVKWENVGIRELPYSSKELSNKITELSNSFKDKLKYGHLFLNVELFNSIGKLYKSITDRWK